MPDELASSGFPDGPFYRLPILATTGSLSKFNGRSMLMRKEQVDRWFASRGMLSSLSRKGRKGDSGLLTPMIALAVR
jgi:hypothetical protein